jgi:hypothetical protein
METNEEIGKLAMEIFWPNSIKYQSFTKITENAHAENKSISVGKLH